MADMILGSTGAQDLLGERFINRLDAPNPFAEVKDSVLSNVIGKIERDATDRRDILENQLSRLRQIDTPFGPDQLQGFEGDVLDAIADARIGFGMEQARSEEGFRRNALSDLMGFNQQLIGNLGAGMDLASRDVAQQIQERRDVENTAIADLFQEAGFNNAVLGSQADFRDQGLNFGLNFLGGLGSQANTAGSNAANIFGNIAQRSSQPSPFDNSLLAILSNPNFSL
jgi:hypothetical protein